MSALIVSACASVPAQHMSDARQALRAAEQAGGNAQAPELYAQAEAHLAKAKAALRQRAYDRARLHARLAKANALKARHRAMDDGQ